MTFSTFDLGDGMSSIGIIESKSGDELGLFEDGTSSRERKRK